MKGKKNGSNGKGKSGNGEKGGCTKRKTKRNGDGHYKERRRC
ncbi:hypothetical protein ACFL24_02150 [Patescibacteria group bacterium]